MGNRTSRSKSSQKKVNRSSNTTFNQQHFDKLQMDSHYNVLDKILNHHLILMQPNTHTQQPALTIHKNALNIAINYHINATYSNSPNYEQSRQIVYIF